MRFYQIKLLGLSLLGQLFYSGMALAVDQTEIKIEGRWSVVGVISGEPNAHGKATGIAVLRSNLTKRTYTLTVGDSVPNEFGFVLKSVKAHSVEIASNSSGAVTLNFADTAAEVTDAAPAETPSRSSRFLESYYRGFNHNRNSRGRAAIDEDEDDGDAFVPAPVAIGTPQLSVTHDEATARPETYRPRTYKMDEDGEGFTVNFDDDEENSRATD